MILVAVVGLRWIAAAAAGGPSSLTLWLLAMLLFFIPEGLVVAELAARYPEEGGVYVWSKRALGEFHGFVCGWCYWVNNLFYFPSLLIFVSANVAFVFNGLRPGLALEEDKLFVTSLTLGILWLVALFNFLGMRSGRWLQNLGGIANWIPVLLLILLGGLAWWFFEVANSFAWPNLIPSLADPGRLSFFAEMCFAFAGLELIAVMAGEVENPRRTITRAIAISGVAIAGVYVLGTAAILVSVPQAEVTTVNGILLPTQRVAGSFGLGGLALVSACLIAVAGCGGTMAWFAGASRMPYVVGVDRYLPAAFGKVHPRRGTPHVAIFVQTALATLFTLIATAGSGTRVDTAYNILVDMCLILYFIPFLYLFVAVLRLRKERSSSPAGFRIPGGRLGTWAAGGLGLLSTALAIWMAVVPANAGGDPAYLVKSLGGCLFMIGLGLVFYFKNRPPRRAMS